MILIMTAASTESDVLVVILFIISVFIIPTSCLEITVDVMNTAIPISIEVLLLSSTGPVRACESSGPTRPIRTETNVAITMSAMSAGAMHPLIYSNRSLSVSFLSGRGL